MSDDASERPAEKVVRPGGLNSLNPIGVVFRHIANRLRFGFFPTQRLLNSNDPAVQVSTKTLIRPAHSTAGMNAEQRNTCPVLKDLDRDYFHLAGSRAQLLAQACDGRRVEQGA